MTNNPDDVEKFKNIIEGRRKELNGWVARCYAGFAPKAPTSHLGMKFRGIHSCVQGFRIL
ncbi:MAG: hypothetical protein KAT65_16755 [Methanophagales archaeon]|nr:hypothetical protein [Methanophagales archaeon]